MFLRVSSWCVLQPSAVSWSSVFFKKTVAEEATAAREGDARQHLPVADVRYPAVQEVDPSKVRMPENDLISAPAGSPNVVVILLDDLGFGGPASFGGAIAMPTLGHLASNGLRFNRFHTVALCAPTRAALRHGRNHHVLNMGSIPEIATGFLVIRVVFRMTQRRLQRF